MDDVTVIVPVADVHDGSVIVTVGARGAPGTEFMTTLPDDAEIQPDSFVTVKLYVSAVRPVSVFVVPLPVIVPGLIVQVPVAGKPFSTTCPDAASHVEG